MIKGNAAEIGALAKSDEVRKISHCVIGRFRTIRIQVKSKGVDAAGEGFTNPAAMLKQLARAERA